MRKTKQRLILQHDAAEEEVLQLAKEYIRESDTLVTSYHNLGNPSIHRIINSYQWEELVILPTSETIVEYVALILSRVNKVSVYGSEEELSKYINTYVDFIPEKSGQIRKAKMRGKSIAELV